ncbi:MAG: hypothetical protein NT047_00370 [Deltaproteobacteria bacterium]|nr:hypothetical protein [Deltaproteobacteria bacterium]
MDANLIDYINRYLRTYIKTKRDGVLNSLSVALKEEKSDQIKIELMASALWIRVDMELLFRAVFWADLEEDQLRARIQSDQKDILQKIKDRLELKDAKKIDGLLTEVTNRQKSLPTVNKQIENNAEILKKDIWHKEILRTLYGAFYGRLSKLAHPDPYFTFWDENLIVTEGDEIIRMLSSCAKEIDREWCDLKKESLHLKNLNKT